MTTATHGPVRSSFSYVSDPSGTELRKALLIPIAVRPVDRGHRGSFLVGAGAAFTLLAGLIRVIVA